MFSEVIEDSISNNGRRLTTLQLRYPRFIHSEFMTHRVFSRNASSSRAIPVAKFLKQIREAPALPIHWGKNVPGMQAWEELDSSSKVKAQEIWRDAANQMAGTVEKLSELGLHKQVANRLLEPFSFISVIVSATEWANFFELRDHNDAQPEIQALARSIKYSMEHSAPVKRSSDQTLESSWHLPYVRDHERASLGLNVLIKLSAARCARVSYLTHDGAEPSVDNDLKLFDRLVGAKPIHASPIEHQAYPDISGDSFFGNFHGWVQFRKIFEKSGVS